MAMYQNRFEMVDLSWKTLYRLGGLAALLAGVIFRRNIGAEVALFGGISSPATIPDWFTLLRNQPLVGMALLEFFDNINYALLGLMFLALCVALWRTDKVNALLGAACGLGGIVVNFASDITFSMLSLSQQYAAATSEAQRASIAAAGQAVLALNDQAEIFRGTGPYLSLLLLAIAGLVFSFAMLRSSMHSSIRSSMQSNIFSRWIAFFGILAGACDLAYCVTFAFAPALIAYLLAAGGLFWIIWHIWIAVRLLQLSREKL
jgi:hypothetical protein